MRVAPHHSTVPVGGSMPDPMRVDCLKELEQIENDWSSLEGVAQILSQIHDPIEVMCASIQAVRTFREQCAEERDQYTSMETLWRIAEEVNNHWSKEWAEYFDEERKVLLMQITDLKMQLIKAQDLRTLSTLIRTECPIRDIIPTQTSYKSRTTTKNIPRKRKKNPQA